VGLRGSVLATWARRTMPQRAQPASPRGNPRATLLEGGGKLAPHSSPLAAGPRTWRRGQAGRPASYIREGWGTAPLPPNPSRRPIAAPQLPSLATARRRSPAAEILHHKHHTVMLLIQSISPPYLLDQGGRRRRCTIRVHLSEASPLAVLDRIARRRRLVRLHHPRSIEHFRRAISSRV
jgi:hypothetical protein